MLVTVVLMCAVFVLAFYWMLTPDQSNDSSEETGMPYVASAGNGGAAVQPDTGVTDLFSRSSTGRASRQPYQNPLLVPMAESGDLTIPATIANAIPSDITLIQYLYSGTKKVQTAAMDPAIRFPDPLDAQRVPGILTFRGTSYRNAPSWGYADAQTETLSQVWEFKGIGELPSADGTFNWKGTGWTGQPLVVQWPSEVLQWMNIYPEKKVKANLKEVIVAALDGKVYFLDYDDGTATRPPINVGATMKCTPAVDPRGYPLLYMGQGDDNGPQGTARIWIYSLLDGQRLFFQEGYDSRAFRISWGCADSSPIVSAEADVLLYPSENGLLYAFKLNSRFDAMTGSLSIAPETGSYAFSYLVEGQPAASVGIESSIAVYNRYAYWTDNNGYLVCLDLESFEILWMKQLGDQTDVTPVLEEVDGHVYLYVSTKVESQRAGGEAYVGMAYTYKFDALTGGVVWQTSFPAWTDPDYGQGGSFGTPVLGKKSIDDLVIFPYCRTIDAKQGSHLVAFNKITGEKVWDYAMSAVSWSSPVDCYRADGKAYIVMTDSLGQIHLVDGETGQRLDYIQLMTNKGTEMESKSGLAIESTPVVFDGRIIVGTRSGSVFAADLM